ncbi:MAG: iron ABC transporter permease [Bacilli bacterium]|jgi:iron(III) transport system permease protein|nr:iron ABC transporter permease [Bacilli bacterium]
MEKGNPGSNGPSSKTPGSTRLDPMNRNFNRQVVRGFNNVKTYFSNPANTLLCIFLVILLILNVAPMISVVKDAFTFHVGETDALYNDTDPGSFTTYHWVEVFASDTSTGYFWKPLGHSLLVSTLACAFAIIFGGLAAYFICRTNMKLKKFISAVFIFPYIMPQWTLALFWKNFFISTECGKLGYVGELQALTGIASPLWFVFGAFPISVVLGLHYAPFAYILIGGVLRNMDANLEEAATILNIPKWKTFFKVTIPMLKPAILSTILLVFSAAMSSYPVAQTLGTPVNYFVLAVKMKGMIEGSSGAKIGQGAIVSIVLILFGFAILAMNQIATGSRKQFTTVSGKSGQVTKIDLGKVGKWIAGIVFTILVVFFCIGPMISFLIESLVPNPGDYSSGLTFYYWTTSNIIRNDYHGVFNEPKIWEALKGSVILAISCSLIAGTCGLLIGYAVAKKRKSKLAQFVNGLAFFPYLLPSVSLSAVFMLLALSLSKDHITYFYKNPMVVCIILGSLKYIPFASRSSLNAMMQLSGEIEEAGVIQNVHWWKRMTRIVFPIQKSAFLSGYLLPFISCMRELNLFIFIGSDTMILTKFMYLLEDTGVAALENAANLILVVIILVVNWGVNLLTGASIDKGIGGK